MAMTTLSPATTCRELILCDAHARRRVGGARDHVPSRVVYDVIPEAYTKQSMTSYGLINRHSQRYYLWPHCRIRQTGSH